MLPFLKRISTYLIIFLFISFSFSAFPKIIFADGMGFYKPDPFADRWDYSRENNQQAFINYDKGIEKLIIGVDFKDTSSNMLWIFPVPAPPEKVKINIADRLPELNGEELSSKAKSNLTDIKKFLLSSQIYTLPYVFISGFGSYNTNSWGMKGTPGIMGGISLGQNNVPETDVIVYSHLEKEGMASEIITTRTSNGLYDYLKSKNLNVDKSIVSVLDSYMGKEYSFIASWIKLPPPTAEEFDSSLIQIFKYPDNYPLFNNIILGLIRISPDFYRINDLAVTASAEFMNNKRLEFIQNNPELRQKFFNMVQADPGLIKAGSVPSSPNPLSPWDQLIETYNNYPSGIPQNQRGIIVTFPASRIYYPLIPTSVYGDTVIPASVRIVGHVSPDIFPDIKNFSKVKYYEGKAKELFVGDEKFFDKLQNINYTKININSPSKNFIQDLWIDPHPPITLFISSFIGNHPNITKIILLALLSMFSGFILSIVIFPEARTANGFRKYLILGLFNFISLFGLIIAVLFYRTKPLDIDSQLPAQLEQKGYFRKRKAALVLLIILTPITLLMLSFAFLDSLYFNMFQPNFIHIIFFLLIPVALFIFVMRIKRVKKEDKLLFDQLKAGGFSTWTFLPKDSRKLLFLPAFSLFFVMLSLLVINLLEKIL